eukprot:TRINITY_DN116119_c0_g1_i1.p1 TRINITY_DN116119_c0_g1~~TRINITY_DN116119_c0_g1_i1.p1  ORF type:complete len:320 (-),score=-2.39 TRINITY_DN116119_c0_g1_i1:111-1070(-)
MSEECGIPSTWVGAIFGCSAHVLWGLLPLYWTAFHGGIKSLEMLSHRVLWSVACLWFTLLFRRANWDKLAALRHNPRHLATFCLSGMLLLTNWGLFIVAVTLGRVVEVSLGYFISPLVSVVLGRIVLGEQLTQAQKVAVLLSTLGVVGMSSQSDVFPFFGICLSITFSFYGLLRKQSTLPSLEGLSVETTAMAPIALGLLTYLEVHGMASWRSQLRLTILSVGCGPITVIPLLFFAAGAQRIQLSTLGILQFINPTTKLLLGVFVYGEAFNIWRGVAFGFIWAGCATYSASMLRKQQLEKVVSIDEPLEPDTPPKETTV